MTYTRKIGYITQFLSVALVFAITSAAIGILPYRKDDTKPVSAGNAPTAPIIVIDPGHGGEDGGASSDDGIHEKDLNLEVSDLISKLLKMSGADVRQSRTSDKMLYDLYGDMTDYSGKKKTFDLRNRIRFSDEANADLFVSIHMNKFFQKQYSGLQVYYSPNDPSSKDYAESVKSFVKSYLQPQNDRETKRATSSIYILNHIQTPAILIECGFLSNPEECALLTTEEYQRSLAAVISLALMESASK